MSFSETIFLFFLALIIFGPKKLPEIARQVGKALNEFRRASNEFKAQIEQEIAHLEVENRQTILPPSPTPEGATSRTLNAAPTENVPSEPPLIEPPLIEPLSIEPPATPAASEDEPLFATKANGGADSDPVAAGTVTSSTSQESHA